MIHSQDRQHSKTATAKVIEYGDRFQLAWFDGFSCLGVVTNQDDVFAEVITFPTEEAAKAARLEANRLTQQFMSRI